MGFFGDVLKTGQDILGQTGLGRVAGNQGIGNPNIKTNEAQRRADQLRDAIIARRQQLEGRQGVYHTLPEAQTYEASEVGEIPQIDMATGGRGEILGLSRKLAQSEGVSAAMDQHRLATDRGMAQALALAATRRNPAALRAGLDAQGQIQSQSGLQSSLLRSREQQQRDANLARAAQIQAGVRGQDIGASTGQARINLATALANQRARQQASQFGADAFNRRAQADMAAKIEQDRSLSQDIGRTFDQQGGTSRTAADIAREQSQQQARRTGGIISGIGNIFAGGGTF